MATTRFINTNFWRDSYISDLDPTHKLLFLYLLTNPQTTLAGFYEINLKQMAFDTDISVADLATMLAKFEADNKLQYHENWLLLFNFLKHQKFNQSMFRNVQKSLHDAPEWIRETVENSKVYRGIEYTLYAQSGDSLSTPHGQIKEKKLNKTKLNLNKTKGADTPGFDKSKNMNPKVYAQAVQADEALKAKEHGAAERKPEGSGIQSAREIAEKIKLRNK